MPSSHCARALLPTVQVKVKGQVSITKLTPYSSTPEWQHEGLFRDVSASQELLLEVLAIQGGPHACSQLVPATPHKGDSLITLCDAHIVEGACHQTGSHCL